MCSILGNDLSVVLVFKTPFSYYFVSLCVDIVKRFDNKQAPLALYFHCYVYYYNLYVERGSSYIFVLSLISTLCTLIPSEKEQTK